MMIWLFLRYGNVSNNSSIIITSFVKYKYSFVHYIINFGTKKTCSSFEEQVFLANADNNDTVKPSVTIVSAGLAIVSESMNR